MGAPRLKQDAQILRVGEIFGRYRIEGRLGRGGMGAVYAATHVELNKRVAIKTLFPSIARHDDARARFVREGQAVSRIRHPHVVDVYDVGIERGIMYLVMELLEGESLGSRLKREGKLSEQNAVDIMIPVLAAISCAHDEGVIHRDLKPGNIFLSHERSGEPNPKVVDFGISKILSDDHAPGLTSPGALIGTPCYMSPEQARGEIVIDGRSDTYALGVILYQMVTGKRPFEAESIYKTLLEIAEGSFKPPRSLNPAISPELDHAISKAIARAPEQRFVSAQDFARKLLPLASERKRLHWAPSFGGYDARKEPLEVDQPTERLAPVEPETARADPVPRSRKRSILAICAGVLAIGVVVFNVARSRSDVVKILEHAEPIVIEATPKVLPATEVVPEIVETVETDIEPPKTETPRKPEKKVVAPVELDESPESATIDSSEIKDVVFELDERALPVVATALERLQRDPRNKAARLRLVEVIRERGLPRLPDPEAGMIRRCVAETEAVVDAEAALKALEVCVLRLGSALRSL